MQLRVPSAGRRTSGTAARAVRAVALGRRSLGHGRDRGSGRLIEKDQNRVRSAECRDQWRHRQIGAGFDRERSASEECSDLSAGA